MIHKEICIKCHLECAKRRGGIGVRGYNSQGYWACCYMVDNNPGGPIDVVGVKECQYPPPGCYYLFEQVIMSTMAKAEYL
jgi:hypothetical protein